MEVPNTAPVVRPVQYEPPPPHHTTGKVTIAGPEGVMKELKVKRGDATLSRWDRLFTTWHKVHVSTDTVVWAKQSDLATLFKVKESVVPAFLRKSPVLKDVSGYFCLSSEDLLKAEGEGKMTPEIRERLAVAAAELRQAEVSEEDLPFLPELKKYFTQLLTETKPEASRVEALETLCKQMELAFGPDPECKALILEKRCAFFGISKSAAPKFFEIIGPKMLLTLGRYFACDAEALKTTLDPKDREHLAIAAAELRQAGMSEQDLPLLSELKKYFTELLDEIKPTDVTVEAVETVCNQARLAAGPADAALDALVEKKLFEVGEARLTQVLEREERRQLGLTPEQEVYPFMKEEIATVSKFVVRQLSAHPGSLTKAEKEIQVPAKDWPNSYEVQYDRRTGDVILRHGEVLGKGTSKVVWAGIFLRGMESLLAAVGMPLHNTREIEKELRILRDPELGKVTQRLREYRVTPYEGGDWKNLGTWLCTERMGHDLQKMPLENLTAGECTNVMQQLASFLFAMHHRKNEKGEEDPAIHFDIKPANIMYDVTGLPGNRKIKAVFIDFGSHFYLSDKQDDNDPRVWAVAEKKSYGSPAITPPEFCTADVTTLNYQKADVWALGHVFFSLVTGGANIASHLPNNFEKLVRAPKQKQIAIQKAVEQAMESAEQKIPDDCKALFGLCKQMLAFDPDKRLSIDQVVDALTSIGQPGEPTQT